MNKLIKISMLTCGLISALNADIMRVEAGAGVWIQESKGQTSYTDGLATGMDKIQDESFNQGYAWILFKHPLPVIPNLRLEYTNTQYNGSVSGKLADFNLPTNISSNSTMEMQQFDVIPYYNLIDNTFWLTLDVGIDLKIINSKYQAASVQDPILNTTIFDGYNESVSLVIPLVYVRTRAEIPGTNIGLESDIKIISYDGNSVTDFRAKVDYTLDMFPVIQPALEIGYRYQKIEVDSEGTLSNIEFSGIYAGLMVKF